MRSLRRFLILLDARNKEFLRDRAALTWNLLFPVFVVLGFSFAFSGGSQNIFKVAVYREAAAADEHPAFLDTHFVGFIPTADLDDSLAKLKRQQLDMVVSLGPKNRYWINSTAPKGYLLEKIVHSGDDRGGKAFERQSVEGREIRYVDWLISGLLALNIMFSALFGVGYTIVRYRKTGVLRRFKATPLPAAEFLAVQVASRLLLIFVITVIVYIGCNLMVRFQMVGSYLDLLIVLMLGSMCLISLGLLVASRIKSEEFAGGLLNLLTWPMMFFSGAWFSLEGMNPLLKKAALVFPLTHVVDAARAIMTEGAGLSQVRFNLICLAAMTAVFLTLGAAFFKWE